MTRVCIIGAGAVGGYIGAHMTQAGIDVTLVDAWPAHVEAMRANGITVTGMNGAGSVRTPVRALHIGDVSQFVREKPFDVAFIAVKSYDTTWATQLVLPYLAPTGCVVSMQNGINEETIAAVAGWGRTLGCSVSALAAELVEPGQIVRNSPLGDDKKAGLRIGELHGQLTPRAQRLAELLAHGDTCKVTSNLWGERWSKLTINAMRNGVCALTGMTGKQRDTNDLSRELTIRLGSSCIRVGRALGLSLEPVGGLDLDLLARADEDAAAHAAITRMIMEVANSRSDAQRPSMGQDILKGRRTETAFINGLVARRGEEVGVDVRFHRRVDDVIQRIEKGELVPSPSLLQDICA
ncbi:2-dehydropantoate 2-reductase [soil metagenome]